MASPSSPADSLVAPRYATWQAALADAVTDPAELCRVLGLPATVATDAGCAATGFRLLVPRHYLARIEPGNPRDPLLLQVLPAGEELDPTPRFITDPLGEADRAPSPGLLWKYSNRALIVTTSACAVHCRFCFRRHFPYEQGTRHWQAALERIAAEPSIAEVILSGGDPLALGDAPLELLAQRIAAIPHVRRLRIHTRLPVLIPQRVTDELLSFLRGGRLTPIVVIHVNHPREIDHEVSVALTRLIDAGIPVLNQAVLLRAVNDDVDTLAALCERLVDLRVMPYYLHQLDRVSGTAHFEVPVETGVRLIQELRVRLPGYAVPRYVREIPGEPNKVVLA